VSVYGLSQSTTEDDLGIHFSKYGVLKRCEILRDSITKLSTGSAQLEYSSASEVEKVLSSTHILDGRNLCLRYDRHVEHSENVPPSDSTKLFVGCLPQGTSTYDLKKCFSEYQSVENVWLSSSPYDGYCYGFVIMSSSVEVAHALSVTHVLKGNVLTVSYSCDN